MMSRHSVRLALQTPVRLDSATALFPELASLVFAQLPMDSRQRCREVSRGWRLSPVAASLPALL